MGHTDFYNRYFYQYGMDYNDVIIERSIRYNDNLNDIEETKDRLRSLS